MPKSPASLCYANTLVKKKREKYSRNRTRPIRSSLHAPTLFSRVGKGNIRTHYWLVDFCFDRAYKRGHAFIFYCLAFKEIVCLYPKYYHNKHEVSVRATNRLSRAMQHN